MKTNPSYIFFTDFDGTITTSDSNDYLTDTIGFGVEKRKQGNQDVLHGRLNFRDSFQSMMDSITTPYEKCISTLLAHIKLDPGFKDFHAYAKETNIPIVVLSSGMEMIIRALLNKLLGEDAAADIQIVSNHAVAREGRDMMTDASGWKIIFHDPESGFGHDKSLEIAKYKALDNKPVMFYAGDGVSDLSAAKETDLLFAKKGHDLIQYCIREDVPFTEFEDWTVITETVKKIVNGETDVKAVAKMGRKEAESA